MRKWVLIVVAVLLSFGTTGPVTAKNLPIEAFFGNFVGRGFAWKGESLKITLTPRDLDVSIEREGAGVRLDWTSVIRRGDDASKPIIRRNKSSKVLRPGGLAEGVFRCADSSDPETWKELCWARIEENTLSVFIVTVERNGIYELQQYDRTLSKAGMKLQFRSWRDGDRLRSVSGQLIRQSN